MPEVRTPRLIGVKTWASRAKVVQAPLPNGLYALERADYFRHPQVLLDQDEEVAYRRSSLLLQVGPAATEQWRAVRRECLAVSESCGLLDFSSLSRFVVEGPGASAMLQRICANTVAGPDVPVNALKYTMRTDENGGVIGSLTILKMAEEKYLLMCYALTSRFDYAALMEHLPTGVTLSDVTWDYSLLMVTGPKTDCVLQPLMRVSDWEQVAALPNFSAADVNIAGQPTTVSRVSYCGGLGYELHVPNANGAAVALYDALQGNSSVTEIGYTATNLMRTEAARPFFTVDIPMRARYLDCVPKFLAKLGDNQHDFVGKAAIKNGVGASKFQVHLAAEDPHFFMSCLNVVAPEVGGKHRILFDGHDVGYVTSGFYGFRAGRSVMFALLDTRSDLGLTGKKALTKAQLGRLKVSDDSGVSGTVVSVVKDAEMLIAQ